MSTFVGAQLDNYRILEKLGEGGMGAVYRAVDVMLEREVALKFLRPELAHQPDLVERFRAEAVVLARLNHQFIAAVYGLHRFESDWFMAMEFVPGETLEHRLKASPPHVPTDAALHLTSMVLQALQYAHRFGVIHRDIKPANIILTPDGTLKVMDFGIARVLGSERLTRAGTIVGTLGYMAPEQIQGLDIDQRVDLYATGIMLYEMLAGRLPFEAKTDWAMMQAQIGETPPPLREFVNTVPESIERVVLTALEKSPDRRFRSASDFHYALEQAARAAGVEGLGRSRPWDTAAALDTRATTQLTPIPGVTSWEETRIGGQTPVPGEKREGDSGARPPFAPPRTAGTSRPPTSPSALAGTPPPIPQTAVTAVPAATSATDIQLTPEHTTPIVPTRPSAGEPVAGAPGRANSAKKKSTAPLVFGAALVLLVAAGAAGWLAWQSRNTAGVATQPPAVSAPAPPVSSPASPASSDQAATNAPGGAMDGAPPPQDTTAVGTPAPDTSQPVSTTAATPTPPVPAGAPTTTRRRPAATPAAATSTAPPTETAAAPLPTPAPPQAELAAPPAVTAASPIVFKDVRLIRPNGPEIDAELHFEPSVLLVRNSGGRQSLTGLRYDNLAAAEYHESRQLRVFVKTTRYWLVLHGKGGEQVRLRLDKDNAKQIIGAIEQHTGIKVQRREGEQDK